MEADVESEVEDRNPHATSVLEKVTMVEKEKASSSPLMDHLP